MLFNSLPEGIVRFSHKIIAYERSGDSLIITAEASEGSSSTKEVKFTADFLVAADGSNSTIRRLMYPEDKRRFALLYHSLLLMALRLKKLYSGLMVDQTASNDELRILI